MIFLFDLFNFYVLFMQKFKNLYYIYLFYSLTLFILKFLIQEKMKEMEQKPVPEGGTTLSTKEIVKRIIGNNFRDFGCDAPKPEGHFCTFFFFTLKKKST